jgi:hypothetical protein
VRAAAVLCTLLAVPVAAHAELYKWVDAPPVVVAVPAFQQPAFIAAPAFFPAYGFPVAHGRFVRARGFHSGIRLAIGRPARR